MKKEVTGEIAAVDTNEKKVIKVEKSAVVNTVFDWANSLFSALIVVLLLMTFLFRMIDVDGVSMEPTLIDTDKVILTDLFYSPSDGDVVVISHGEEYANPLIKRVIATPGQKLKIDFDENKVYVDDELLDEPYIQGITVRGDAEIPEVIPEGYVFVMGDNRGISLDSRYHEVGLIKIDSIIGKAQFVVVPHTYSDSGTPVLDFSKVRYIY